MLEPTGEERQAAEQSEMGQMLAPRLETYYQRQVTPAFLGAMDATETVVNRLHPQGHDRTVIERQLRDMGERLKTAQSLSAMGLQMGADFNQPTRVAIERVAATLQRQPDGAQAAARLKAVSNMIDQRRLAEEMFK